MTTTSQVRVRFAPAPTGMMHLGNVRTALMNYLFARQTGGTFILRVEDTDQQRNYDPKAEKIIDDLLWLGIDYNQGPVKGGPDAPYFQSQRDSIYLEQLELLKKKNLVYRCFCTPEELDKKRQRQIALKLPPRYDRACLDLSATAVAELLAKQVPHIWRIQLDQSKEITIHDLARGPITFDIKNFSDFPLTRADGTVTFMFANFVDDMLMRITHVIRGEDHLTNTAGQATLYLAFDQELPTFWHLPIICNAQGKKLSKRDFGFSLQDLRKTGFLPQAIDNYLAIIGGGTFQEEIMSLDDLIKHMNFKTMNSTGHVRYDVEKLRWLNHKWINRLSNNELTALCQPLIHAAYPESLDLNSKELEQLVSFIKTDIQTLDDVPGLVKFYFTNPMLQRTTIADIIGSDTIAPVQQLVKEHLALIHNSVEFVSTVKDDAKVNGISVAPVFKFLRLALIGNHNGPAINDIIDMLGAPESLARIEKAVNL
ncbi:glutamate--tRNA ligase [Candidatus Dependentiae bacterium Noda2021]|nr:glutamate--tRNA ligase [Candidatus Dependentiae bacterium Noda2021]